MGILFWVGFVLSVIFIFFVSRRYNFPALPSIFSHALGFLVSASISSLIFSFMVGESSWLFSDVSSLLGGGLGWSVIVFATITTSLKPIREKVEGEISSYKSKLAQHHSMMRVFRTMFGLGLISVIVGSFCASIVNQFAFFMYGFVGLNFEMIPDSIFWMLRIPYILVSMGIAYLIFWIILGRKKSGTKYEQLPETQFDSATTQLPPVKLWSSRFIGFASFFLGFPSGIALSAINWNRMGLNKKVVFHVAVGVIGIFALVIILLLLPGNRGRGLAGLVNFGMLYYLYSQTKKDTEVFKANNHIVENAHWFGGCLISLLMVGLYFFLAFLVVMVLMFLGIPIPE